MISGIAARRDRQAATGMFALARLIIKFRITVQRMTPV